MSKSSQRNGPRPPRNPVADARSLEVQRRQAEAQQVNSFIQQLFQREETLQLIADKARSLVDTPGAPPASELLPLAEDATRARNETTAAIIETLSHVTGLRQPSPIETPSVTEVVATDATRLP